MIANTDFGLGSISDVDIPKIDLSAWSEFSKFWEWTKKPDCKNTEIVIDDLTELVTLCVQAMLKTTSHGQKAYGMMADEILKLLKEARNRRDKICIFICKEEIIQDDQKRLMKAPMIPGQAVQPLLPYLLGQIYHMETWADDKQNMHEVFRCKRNDQCEAGDRTGKLGEIEFANFAQLHQKMYA